MLLGGCGVGSAQELWLRADLAANASENVIALWHKPRYSSGQTNLQALQPLWDDLYAAGVDILLDGHDHIYERFVPMKSGATPADPPVEDPIYGIQQFTVGTGGEAHHSLGTTLSTSVVRNNDTFGIFKLTLHADSYDWVFLPIDGYTFTDSGTGAVHGAPTSTGWTHVGTGPLAATFGSSSTSTSVGYPAGIAAGDLLLLGCQGRHNSMDWSAPGFGSLIRTTLTSGLRFEVLSAWAAGGESGSLTVTSTIGMNGWSCELSAFRGGLGAGSPLAAAPVAVAGSGSTMTAPSVTTATGGALVTRWFASMDDNNHGNPSAGSLAFGGTAYHTTVGVSPRRQHGLPRAGQRRRQRHGHHGPAGQRRRRLDRGDHRLHPGQWRPAHQPERDRQPGRQPG